VRRGEKLVLQRAENRRPDVTLDQRLMLPDALLSRSDLRDLGLGRRAVDAIFRALPVVALPDYSRPLIKVSDYVAYIATHTYNDDRVRP
jgi:hypothetical protein